MSDSLGYRGMYRVVISMDRGGVYDLYTDFGLVPSSKPYIEPRKHREKYVEVPGRHGSIDLCELFSDTPLYDDITGSLEFIIQNKRFYNLLPNPATNPNSLDDFGTFKRKIETALNGGTGSITILHDGTSETFKGRFWVDGYGNEESHSTVTIGYRVAPNTN